MSTDHNYCVILAGGYGTRLWPLSRQARPKQFLDLTGSGETLLQMTYKRFARFICRDNIIVVSNHHYEPLVREQLPDLPAANLLLEPMRRNTVPSVTWAASEIAQRDAEAVMVVAPTDQLLVPDGTLEDDVALALDYGARHDRLLALGVVPTAADTRFGYIQMAEAQGEDIYRVQSFTEKPEAEFAKLFVESREFLWNTGLFVWSVRTYLGAIHDNATQFLDVMAEAHRSLQRGETLQHLVDEMYAVSPNVSLEQAVLERWSNVDVMLCHFSWRDIGTWSSLYDISAKDAHGNALLASRCLTYDCHGCVVRLPRGRVAVLQGLDDYIVAEEGNVLVVCRRGDQSAIRKFVNDVQMEAGDEFV